MNEDVLPPDNLFLCSDKNPKDDGAGEGDGGACCDTQIEASTARAAIPTSITERGAPAEAYVVENVVAEMGAIRQEPEIPQRLKV
jgi:hypothetical protein